MKKLFILFILLAFAQPVFAKCTFTQKRIKGMTDQDCRLAQKEKVMQQKIDTKKREQALEVKEQELNQSQNSGTQTANSGTIVNLGGGGGNGNGATATTEEASYFEESVIEVFVSSALFELSPQQPGADRQFLTGQNSGGTALGVRYKFSKGIALVAMYEKFQYAGKEFDREDSATITVEKEDEFGHVIYDDDGNAETEEVTSYDNSYLWADRYEHTRYMIGLSMRGAFTDDRKYTWDLDVYPMGWYTTKYVHSGERGNEDEEHSASKSYGFRGNINYRVSPDFTVTGYYQMIDAKAEGDKFASDYKPLGSAEFGVSASFGLPDMMGKLYY